MQTNCLNRVASIGLIFGRSIGVEDGNISIIVVDQVYCVCNVYKFNGTEAVGSGDFLRQCHLVACMELDGVCLLDLRRPGIFHWLTFVGH